MLILEITTNNIISTFEKEINSKIYKKINHFLFISHYIKN